MLLGLIFGARWPLRHRPERVAFARRSADIPDQLTFRLQWRTPLYFWQTVSWLVVTLVSPTSWIIGILLWLDARSDHPFFWPALIALVALVNATAILSLQRRSRLCQFATRARLAARYLRLSLSLGSVGFILLSWSTGFLQDFSVPLARAFGVVDTQNTLSIFLDALLALLFGLLSFLHAGVLYAFMGYRDAVAERGLPKATKSRQFRHCVPPKS